MSKKKDTLHIGITLEGEVKQKIAEIRELLGLNNWSDILRYLITQYHRENIENER